MLANWRFTATASHWQVCVNSVGNWHLVTLVTDTAHATDRCPALTHTGHEDTYWAPLSRLWYPVIPLCPQVRARQVSLDLQEHVTVYNRETSRALGCHIATPTCAWIAQGVYFGKCLRRKHSHTVILLFSLSYPLFTFTFTCCLSLIHTHSQRQ